MGGEKNTKPGSAAHRLPSVVPLLAATLPTYPSLSHSLPGTSLGKRAIAEVIRQPGPGREGGKLARCMAGSLACSRRGLAFASSLFALCMHEHV